MAEDKKSSPDDLNDLLDDALKDFKDARDDEESKREQPTEGVAHTGEEKSTSDAANPDAFVMEQVQAFGECMNSLLGGLNTPNDEMKAFGQDPEQILSGFKKMAEAASMTLQGENPADDEEVAKFSDSIAQALRGLQEGSENLTAPAQTDVANMFSGLNLDGSGEEGDGNMFLPFMEGMMQSLLSAEILLPSIKELLDKYPKYLAENGDKISSQDKERFEKQLELYKVIEGHLESEKPDDSAAVKREKFRVVLDDMRKLQEYGQPPQEILAETAGDLPLLDPAGAGAVGPNPQCPMM